jgi:hypothetical protein
VIEPPDRYCAPMWGARQARRAIVWPWLLWAMVIAFAIGAVTCASQARAEPIEFDCAALATGIAMAADFRDAGADLEKTVRLARQRNSDASPEQLAVIDREIRRLWREKRTREASTPAVYKRCRAQLGDMGLES